jgi:hypothetical protein
VALDAHKMLGLFFHDLLDKPIHGKNDTHTVAYAKAVTALYQESPDPKSCVSVQRYNIPWEADRKLDELKIIEMPTTELWLYMRVKRVGNTFQSPPETPAVVHDLSHGLGRPVIGGPHPAPHIPSSPAERTAADSSNQESDNKRVRATPQRMSGGQQANDTGTPMTAIHTPSVSNAPSTNTSSFPGPMPTVPLPTVPMPTAPMPADAVQPASMAQLLGALDTLSRQVGMQHHATQMVCHELHAQKTAQMQAAEQMHNLQNFAANQFRVNQSAMGSVPRGIPGFGAPPLPIANGPHEDDPDL